MTEQDPTTSGFDAIPIERPARARPSLTRRPRALVGGARRQAGAIARGM